MPKYAHKIDFDQENSLASCELDCAELNAAELVTELERTPSIPRRMSLKAAACGVFALCLMPFAVSCDRAAPKRPTAHQVLFGYLDHPASATFVGDSELVVRTIEWSPSPLSGEERKALAAIDVRQIQKHWPDPRLRRVTVVFERLRRLGPIVISKSDTSLVLNVALGGRHP